MKTQTSLSQATPALVDATMNEKQVHAILSFLRKLGAKVDNHHSKRKFVIDTDGETIFRAFRNNKRKWECRIHTLMMVNLQPVLNTASV